MQAIIDRFEGAYAIVEYDGKMYSLPTVFLPAGAREGDVLEINMRIDAEKTKELKKGITELMKKVWK